MSGCTNKTNNIWKNTANVGGIGPEVDSMPEVVLARVIGNVQITKNDTTLLANVVVTENNTSYS